MPPANSTDPAPELVTKTGKVLTDADVQALADEAEHGYELSSITPTARKSLPGSGSLARPTPTAAVSPAAGDGSQPLTMPNPSSTLDVGPFPDVDVREIVSRCATVIAGPVQTSLVIARGHGAVSSSVTEAARNAAYWLDELRDAIDACVASKDDDERGF